MALINIPNNMLAQLTELATEYATQNTRYTAYPLYFNVADIMHVPTSEDYMDGGHYLDASAGDYNLMGTTIAEVVQNLIEAGDNYDLPDDFAELSPAKQEDIIEELGIKYYYHKNVETFKNAFFTAKACDEHIKQNSHHYGANAHSYCEHWFRNPEMELISKLLLHLATQNKET